VKSPNINEKQMKPAKHRLMLAKTIKTASST
jgi:hypothetical protein